MQLIVLYLVFLFHVLNSVVAYSNEFTVTIEAGKEDCYYTTVAKNVYLEVDYQVSRKTGFLLFWFCLFLNNEIINRLLMVNKEN